MLLGRFLLCCVRSAHKVSKLPVFIWLLFTSIQWLLSCSFDI